MGRCSCSLLRSTESSKLLFSSAAAEKLSCSANALRLLLPLPFLLQKTTQVGLLVDALLSR